MADAKQSAEWDRAAAIIAKIHNVNCLEKNDMKDPKDFNLYELGKKPAKKEVPMKVSLKSLQGVLTGNYRPR